MDERQLALIRRLADGRSHSGEAIAREFGLTRAAVWKTLRKTAEAFGLDLISERGRGYRLATPLELLDAERIREALSDAGRARLSRLDIHPLIGSTNSELMRLAAGGAPSGSVCLAERQTAGRGRRGREWVSPFGVNLYLSLLWRYPFAPSNLGGASLAVGAVLADALNSGPRGRRSSGRTICCGGGANSPVCCWRWRESLRGHAIWWSDSDSICA